MDQYQGSFDNQQGDQTSPTWVCPKCHTLNQKNFCCCCGYKRKIPKPAQPMNPWKIVSIVLIVLLLVMGIGMLSGDDTESDPESTKAASVSKEKDTSEVSVLPLCFNGHDFSDATCDEPKICNTCGKTAGNALGHDYTVATCKSASKCTRCNKTTGTALSHSWKSATYTSPETCSLCGETRGNVKGYYASLSSDWSSKRVSVGGTNTTPLIFDETVKNCKQFTLHFQISDVDYGTPYGKFTVYAKIDGKWKKIGTFEADNKSEVVKTLKFDDPITFKQLAFVGPPRSSVSYSFYLWIEDWYLRN